MTADFDKSKLNKALEFAKENGLKSIEVDGIKIHVPDIFDTSKPAMSDKDLEKVFLTPEPEFTDEEILFYATDYFDVLQAQKKEKQERLKAEQQVRMHDGRDILHKRKRTKKMAEQET